MTSPKQGFYYLGISPVLSAENIMARIQLGSSGSELEIADILRIIEAHHHIIIPSHFWGRADCAELMFRLKNFAPKIQIQCGPGREMLENLDFIKEALNLGFGLQILCQRRLNEAQESRIRALPSFDPQIELVYFIQESPELKDDLKYYGELFYENLKLSTLEASSSLIHELAQYSFRIEKLDFLNFETWQIQSLAQLFEQTTEDHASPNISSITISIAQIRRIQFRPFLQTLLIKSFWQLRTLGFESYGLLRCIAVRLFWQIKRILDACFVLALHYPLWPFRKIYWILKFEFQKRILRRYEN